jgi:hypothetical protein
MYTKEQIEAAIKSKGYVWFNDDTNKGYDVNIVGVRNNAAAIADKVTNVFDDFMTLSFKEGGVWKFYQWAITTDPGTKAVKEFSNPNGIIFFSPDGKDFPAELISAKLITLADPIGPVGPLLL